MALALVSYGSSDEGDSDDGDVEQSPPRMSSPCFKQRPIVSEDVASKQENDLASFVQRPERSSLFGALPAPTIANRTEEEEPEVLVSKPEPKQRVKITVPVLTKAEDDEKPTEKKFKPSGKGSGLFSMLPAPRHSLSSRAAPAPNATSETPDSEPQKTAPITKTTSLIPKAVADRQKLLAVHSKPITQVHSNPFSVRDDEEDVELDSLKVDFFSLAQSGEEMDTKAVLSNQTPGLEYTSLHFDCNTQYTIAPAPAARPRSFGYGYKRKQPEPDFESAVSASISSDCITESHEASHEGTSYDEPESPSAGNEINFEDEAFRRIQGRRACSSESVNIIDVNQDDIKANIQQMHLKNMTEEHNHISQASLKKGKHPSSVDKRKHQITYLAHQAKARELELKNQWAQNRYNKKQTQSKYGF